MLNFALFTSSIKGIETVAPALDTAIADALEDSSSASETGNPCSMAWIKYLFYHSFIHNCTETCPKQ
jgi:hypothetical protein